MLAGYIPEDFREMTPRDAILVIRKYYQRDYGEWRRAGYLAVNYANLHLKKKDWVSLDKIMPPFDKLDATPEDKVALKERRTQEAIERADKRVKEFYPEEVNG